MQRARIFTAGEGAAAGARLALAAQLGVPALLLLGIGASAAFLIAHPQTPVFDQARLLEARFEAPYHPAPPFGLSVQLIVIAIKALLPAGVPPAEPVRVAAMALWALSAAWLASALVAHRGLVAALLLLLFTSQLPFLWYSAELFVGALLCFAIGAWVRGAPPWLVGALLGILALAKSELPLLALVLLAYWAWRSPSRRDAARMAAAFSATAALLLLPGLAAFGPGWLTAYDGAGRSRAFATFQQHYAALVAPFQLAPAPDPWRDSASYAARLLPGAGSLREVWLAPRLPLLDFAALALARGVRNAGWLFQWGWLWIAIRCGRIPNLYVSLDLEHGFGFYLCASRWARFAWFSRRTW